MKKRITCRPNKINFKKISSICPFWKLILMLELRRFGRSNRLKRVPPTGCRGRHVPGVMGAYRQLRRPLRGRHAFFFL